VRSPLRLPRRFTRAAGALALVAAVGSALAGCSVVASQPVTVVPSAVSSVAVSDVCARAAELTDEGKPQEALALVGQYRDGIPTPIPTVTRRTSSSTPAPTPTPVVDCEPERIAALDALGQHQLTERVPSPAQSFAKDWGAVVASFFAPLAPMVAATALIFLALLLLARVLALVPWTSRVGSRSRRRRRIILASALSLMIVGVVLFVGTLARGGCASSSRCTRARGLSSRRRPTWWRCCRRWVAHRPKGSRCRSATI
jgi:hypothetical protein